MHIISRQTLKEYWLKHKDVEEALKAWHSEAKNAKWSSPNDIKLKFKSADFLEDNRVIFNIKGNKYRLIVRINYKSKTVFIKFIGTHDEYNKINAKEL